MGAQGWSPAQGPDGGAIGTFLALTDAPASYAGTALFEVRVNAGETGLEFVAPGGASATSVFELVDTDDNSVVEVWAVEHNSPTIGVGPRLATMSESGLFTVGTTAGGAVGTISVQGSGASSEQFGAGAVASGTQSVAAGNTATATNTNAVSVGFGADATAVNSIAIGAVAQATGQDSIVIGVLADDNDATNCVVIGDGATAASAAADRSVVVGSGATSSGLDGTAVGFSATASASGATAVGTGAVSSGTQSCSVGGSSSATMTRSTAFGNDADATAANAIALGGLTDAAFSASIALGALAATTAANQMVVGSTTARISEVVIGEGVADLTPFASVLHTTTNTTVGETDVAATSLVYQSGLGTGAGAVTSIGFNTPDVLGTGTVQQSAVRRLTISELSSTFTNPIGLPSFTVATLPAATATHFIYVSDETGGAVPAFADGTNWRRVTDRAIVA